MLFSLPFLYREAFNWLSSAQNNITEMFLKYTLKKIFFLAFSFFVISTLTFFLMHSIPGDPFLQEQAIPEEILKSMRAHYGLEDSLFVQYFRYLRHLIFFDLGPSFKYEGRAVTTIILETFPTSFLLGSEALVIAVASGISLGLIAAANKGKTVDRFAMLLGVLWISVPNFILATLLQYTLSMKLGWFPVARWDSFLHSVLPAISLAALPMAYIARLTRSCALEVLQQDFIQLAKAKGLSQTQIVLKHVLKNSLLPVVTYLGPLATSILTGSFIVEKIFGIPGLGNWFVSSVMNRDYTVIMGITLFYSALLLAIIFVLDLIYPLLDPRIQKISARETHVTP